MMNETRKKRRDAGRTLWTQRDLAALTWIAEKSAIRLDHLQVLLGHLAGQVVSPGTTRRLVARWRDAGWVEAQRIRACEPIWIWPMCAVYRPPDLPYSFLDLEQKSSLVDLESMAAMNEIRRHLCTREAIWTSQRKLLQEVRRGRILPNLPDAEMHRADGKLIAIKGERGQDELLQLRVCLTGL